MKRSRPQIGSPAASGDLGRLRHELEGSGDSGLAEHATRFFRAEPGGYGEGDRFRGIRVPVLRELARRYRALSARDTERLLRSPWHEDRATALIILVERFRRGDEALRRNVYRSYVAHLDRVDNWDLVDLSAPSIVGGWLQHRSRRPLDRWAASPRLWERRIAVLATLHFIRAGELAPTLKLGRRLVSDPHDLIHKAVGWMLREVGWRDRSALEGFLERHAARMPRTMLRYAIERLPERRRRHWMRR